MEDMISILETYQQYAPKVDGDFIPVPVGGDGLTAKRGEEAQMARKDGASPEAALEGVVLKVEDWHKDTVIMLKVFYSAYSKIGVFASPKRRCKHHGYHCTFSLSTLLDLLQYNVINNKNFRQR